MIFAQDPVSVGLPALLSTKIMGKIFMIRVAGDYAWEQSVQRFGVKDSIDDFQKLKYALPVEFLRYIQKFVVRHADQAITPSIYFQKLVEAWNHKGNVTHIYNGIEFPDLNDDRESSRTKLGIPKDKVVLVTSGRLVPWKGFFGLIDLVEKINKESSNYVLYIIGDGPDKSALSAMIDSKNLGNNIKLCGSVSRQTLFSYLVSADVFILNTAFESFSFQIIEAMYSGVPVISTSIGNLSEIIEDGQEGLLVKPDDITGFHMALKKVMSDYAFRQMIIGKARIKSEIFSIRQTIANLLLILKKYE